MWKVFADYHTHTRYSHGKGTIRDNMLAARAKGLELVGISDHGPAGLGFGIKGLRVVSRMRDEINRLNAEMTGIKAVLGIEANIISVQGKLDLPEEILETLDMTMAGLHYQITPASLADGIKLVLNNIFLAHLHPAWGRQARVSNTEALISAIYRYKIDIITHPGLKADIDTRAVARACAARGTALEINAAHGYLTLQFVKVAAEQGVRFVLGSDAHRPEDVGRLDAAIMVARKAGLRADQIINIREEG